MIKKYFHSDFAKKLFSSQVFTLVGLALSILGLAMVGWRLSLRVSDYPLPVFWSESGRIFEAYQFYAPLISGESFSLPWLDPARAILDGVVLLIPGLKLWMWRLWTAFVSFTMTLAAAFLILRQALKQIHQQGRSPIAKIQVWIIVFYGALFLFQGPVYSHLLVAVLPILAFYQNDKPKRNLVVILFSAIYAGLTRVNWFLMPAVTAAVLYLLQTSKAKQKLISYIKWPLIYGVINGTISLAVYGISLVLAGMPSILSPEMSYFYMRIKLFPNYGFSLGLIPGIALITSPLLIATLVLLWRQIKWYNGWRIFFIVILLAVLGAGSTLVSLRAGGGYDLHNYDTLLLIFLMIGIHFCLGATAKEPEFSDQTQKTLLNDGRVLSALLIIPLIFLARTISPRQAYPHHQGYGSISRINEAVEEAQHTSDAPILFIDHRHLLIFDYVSSETIFMPYEKIVLMEMAMGNNQDFFKEFHVDLEDHRYSLIVSERLFAGIRSASENPFWYENNVWVESVAAPILRYYDIVFEDDVTGIGIYAPKVDQ